MLLEILGKPLPNCGGELLERQNVLSPDGKQCSFPNSLNVITVQIILKVREAQLGAQG